MEALIFDTSFKLIQVIDTFDSFIWTDRYLGYGDFELRLSPTVENMQSLQEDYYIMLNSKGTSWRAMIIEDIQLDSDVENGPTLTVSGRSLESILDRRIVWNQTVVKGNVQEAIKSLLLQNIENPTDPNRCIDGFYFLPSNDEAIKSLEISGEAQFTGDNLYDVIVLLCDIVGISFRIEFTGMGFNFHLYSGVDRSYAQTDRPYVVFSPNFDNLLNSSYFKSKKNLKTVTLVAGEGEGSERKTIESYSTIGATGLDRREMYTDARDISKTVSVDGKTETLTDDEYNTQLAERGAEQLRTYVSIESFDGEVEPNMNYKYGSEYDVEAGLADYSIGDIVQIINEYGMSSRSRITEVIRSESSSGFEIYPTFTKIE